MHPCAKCATLQKTCCQRAEIVLTEGDVLRIAHHTGRIDFHDHRPPAGPEYLEPDDDDPNWLKYTVRADGTRRVLKRAPSGDCTFLGDRGCSLPAEIRPIVCRLYPFSYNERAIKGEDAAYCPRSHLAPPGVTMLTVLGMNLDDGARWHKQLYAELRAGAP